MQLYDLGTPDGGTLAWLLNDLNANGQYLEYPFLISAINKIYNHGVFLRSALNLKKNVLISSFTQNNYLSRGELNKFLMDYLWFGNAYFELIRNKASKVVKLKTLPAKYMRKTYAGDFIYIANNQELITYPKHRIIHFFEPDFNQEYYGQPDWLAALTSAYLNQAATEFRLKYYQNGSHAGYILYISDPEHKQGDIDALKDAFASTRGVGNFKNLLYYAPNGKKDGVQLLPLSEVTARDEFFNIKKVSRDDQLAAARIPPNLMGVVPENTGGFGGVDSAAKVYNRNEIFPLQQLLVDLNRQLGIKAFNFEAYVIE